MNTPALESNPPPSATFEQKESETSERLRDCASKIEEMEQQIKNNESAAIGTSYPLPSSTCAVMLRPIDDAGEAL